jgi:hypothetical protein
MTYLPVPEFIDPVFTKTSPIRSFSLNRKRVFWLVFAKTGSIISGTAFNHYKHRVYMFFVTTSIKIIVFKQSWALSKKVNLIDNYRGLSDLNNFIR